jgi:hypothetical protein
MILTEQRERSTTRVFSGAALLLATNLGLYVK